MLAEIGVKHDALALRRQFAAIFRHFDGRIVSGRFFNSVLDSIIDLVSF